ncbi:hypothetical protein H7H78_17955 [Mycobacterium shinjukuense]|uniref:Uncharacterized protein n=1 Tax=Mycobacterium shinjukuense TaxID=398694 RepID=A0A7I7MSJ0_9MYCO|nr:hypothetical protein [Mycobacterium shinjukuense]MCV6987224.1 hypothetical protein [Mycobacterium shinjukuense]BBX74920.1 hypothetical protein MSHI_28260 [Mycobacterium shinjukuense]
MTEWRHAVLIVLLLAAILPNFTYLVTDPVHLGEGVESWPAMGWIAGRPLSS